MRRGGLSRYRRARLIIGFSWLSLVWSLVFAVLFGTLFHQPLPAVLCLLGTVLLANIHVLLRMANPSVAGNVLVLITFCILGTVSWQLGGFFIPVLVWYAFLPALAEVVGKSGLIWVLVVMAQVLGLYFLDVMGLAPPDRLTPEELKVLSAVSLLGFVGLLVTLTTLYESLEHQTMRRLRRANRELAGARDAALEASRAKTSFLANMSHEFRTPLNAIIGYSDMLLDEGDPPERMVADLVKIKTAGSNLLKMVNDLLDLSKIEAGGSQLDLSEFSIAVLLEDLEGTLRPQVLKGGNRLEVRCPAEVGQLRSDPTKLKQCLLNLLSNASKFTQQGLIKLSVGRQPERVVFEVEDTGIGMNAEELKRVFLPFTQADASISRRFGGTGLGLTICERLARLLGGDLTATSAPGEGSCFKLSIPDLRD